MFHLCRQVTDNPLHTVKVHESGVLVATGCEDGNVALMELTEGLASSNRNDKTAVTAMFERETRREKILEVSNWTATHHTLWASGCSKSFVKVFVKCFLRVPHADC